MLKYVYLLICFTLACHGATPTPSYFIMIDAGSSGSRVHIHAYTKTDGLPEIQPSVNMKIKPGLSSYAAKPLMGGASILQLLEFAKETVPRALWSSTPIHLQATAGLRSVKPRIAELILESCRNQLSASPFMFQRSWARIISGQQEGVNGWLATNYLMGTLGTKSLPSDVDARLEKSGGDDHRQPDKHDDDDDDDDHDDDNDDDDDDDGDNKKDKLNPKDQSTVGVIEMGGASMQITFAPHSLPRKFVRNVPHTEFENDDDEEINRPKNDEIPEQIVALNLVSVGYKYMLYTHSYLNYGLEAAQELFQHSPEIVDHVDEHGNPCYPPHMRFTSVGNYDKCYDLMGIIVNKQAELCYHTSCSFNGIYQPELLGKERFIAIENFFYTSLFFGVHESEDIVSGLHRTGRDFCSREWSNITLSYPHRTPNELSKYCFSAAYVSYLLERGLGFHSVPHRKDIEVKREVNGRSIDWALGAVLYELTRATSHSGNQIATIGWDDGPFDIPGAVRPRYPARTNGTSALVWICLISVPFALCSMMYRRVFKRS